MQTPHSAVLTVVDVLHAVWETSMLAAVNTPRAFIVCTSVSISPTHGERSVHLFSSWIARFSLCALYVLLPSTFTSAR